jgi:hypothetical protein
VRIRSTKPEFWKSERVASVSWEDRLVLKGLESYVDDNGVGKDDLALIVADVFPRDLSTNTRDTLAKVSEALTHLSEAGLLWRYEVKGGRYLYVAFWETIQRIDRPGKGRMPRPDGTMEYKESEIRESVASPRESVAPGTGEQGNRGTGEQTRSATLSPQQDAPRDAHYEDDRSPLETVSPETVLPRNFVASTRHKAFAGERGLDIAHELAAFKAHAKANARTLVDWDAGFNAWLLASAKRAKEKDGSPRPGSSVWDRPASRDGDA